MIPTADRIRLEELPDQTFAKQLPQKYGVERQNIVAMPGWHVWCGSLVANPAGGYAFFFSRWPLETGSGGWVTHSEICRAQGPTPWGPFTYVETVLTREESPEWDAHNFHNVTVKCFGGRYYLYYTGNRGCGEWWAHRNNQRIGVACADSLSGPWVRQKVPLIDISHDSWDSLCVANPTVTDTNDGRYLLLYKGVTDGPRPFGSKVLHGIAQADSPAGPFRKLRTPVFEMPGEKFAFEDPFIWRSGSTYYCLMKDMVGVVGACPRSTIIFSSKDGLCWDTANSRMVASPYLLGPDAHVEEVERLERPHYFADETYPCITFAVKPFGEAESFIVMQPRRLP